MTVCYRCICYQSLQCLVSATVAWICTYNISITNIHNSPIILCLSFCRWYAVFPGRHLLTYKLSYSIRSCSATFHQFHVLHVIHFNKIWTFAPCDFLFLNCELLLTDGQTAKHNAASVDCMTRCMWGCVCVWVMLQCVRLCGWILKSCYAINRDYAGWMQCHIAGYGGVHCELRYTASVIQCLSSPCHNGGLCLPSNASSSSSNNITCVCPIGYVGDDCSIKVWWWNLHSVGLSIKRHVAVFEKKTYLLACINN